MLAAKADTSSTRVEIKMMRKNAITLLASFLGLLASLNVSLAEAQGLYLLRETHLEFATLLLKTG